MGAPGKLIVWCLWVVGSGERGAGEGGVLESRLRMNGQRAREEARWLQ